MVQPHFLKRTACTALVLTFFLSLGLFSGCARKPQLEQAVDAAAKRYASVRSGMTKQEVVTSLGEPTKRKGTLWRWEISANAQSNASLELQFDGADRVTKIVKTHAKRD